MIPGILTPSGNLGGLNPHQVTCSPIAAVALAVGDLVMFDLSGSNATYTDVAQIAELDHKKNPFNVVVLAVAGAAGTSSTTQTGKGGIFRVVLEAATAGNRVKICVSGLCTAKVTTATASPITAGVTVLTNGAGVLISTLGTAQAAAQGAPMAIGFTTVTTASPQSALMMTVLFHGYQFATGGA
jgi:hypothetical protein